MIVEYCSLVFRGNFKNALLKEHSYDCRLLFTVCFPFVSTMNYLLDVENYFLKNTANRNLSLKRCQ
jgi:hypothetical protein